MHADKKRTHMKLKKKIKEEAKTIKTNYKVGLRQ